MDEGRGFSRSWITELRARVDIVDVVSQTVALKKNGGRYWGLCPFHTEKTASFTVRPDLQMYYCFGCKAAGDVIRFVMEIERLEFPEALRELADRAHFPLPETMDLDALRRDRTERDRILALNKRAAHWFHDRLWTAEGKPYLEYLYRRGLDDAGIRRFGLGASGADGQALLTAMKDGESSEDLIVKACLAGRRDGRSFDFFRQRAMFPILDARGNVIAFGGRALGDAQPKYLNSSDTPVFNKRQTVYGIHLLKKARNLRRIVLVEGYMDALTLLNADVVGVVATLGTSLTPEQVTLIKRYAPEALIAYDGDEPGQKAALRALDLFEAEDMPARVVTFPDGMDPDDFIRKEGANARESFESLTTRSAYQFKLARLVLSFDLSKPDERMKYAIESAKILRTVREPVELESLLDRLIVDTGFSKEILMRQIGASPMPIQRTKEPRSERVASNDMPSMLSRDSDKAARILLSLIAVGRVPAGAIDCMDFENPIHQAICRGLLEGQAAAELIEDCAEDDTRAEMLTIFGEAGELPEDSLPRVINDCIERLQSERLNARIKELTSAIGAMQGANRLDGMKELTDLLAKQQRMKIVR
ncbi:hypothetical protein AGMMS49992_07850 [Clostridia bacterium]|nr:hypothetical protein AGMMS49992_07850 [Clostridia bacterium]